MATTAVLALLSLAGAAGFFQPVVQSVRRTTSSVTMGGVLPARNVWTTVCSSKGLQPNSLKAGFGAGQDILVATDKGGKVFAAANVCPHIGTPLDQGSVENGAIICPLHRSAFDLKTGKLVGPWCPSPPLIGPLTGKLKTPKELKTFQARTSGGNVQVLLDVNAKKNFESNYWRGVLDAQGKVDGGYY